MRGTIIGYALGKLLQVIGVVFLAPLAIAIYDSRGTEAGVLSQPDVVGFIISIAVGLVAGTILVMLFRSGREEQGLKEGYAIVTLGWVTMALVSSIPLFAYFLAERGGGLGPVVAHFTDAYFEVMSGFTTTGATIIQDVEAMPRSLLFLRALTHWLGGMGIITLAIAIFPSMGVSAYQMFRGEVPGPSKDRFHPRLAQTVSILWGVYVLFTGVESLLLFFGGMDWFDAITHSFATMATGGFSTRADSIAAFHSDYIEWVVTVFMFLAGVNFILHFRALRGSLGTLTSNSEFRFYAGVTVAGILIATFGLYSFGLADVNHASVAYRTSDLAGDAFVSHYAAQLDEIGSLYDCFRVAAFQVVSIVTTTGFATADFDLWPDFLRFMLVLFMFFGGCAGSTGGGIKMIRIMIVFKVAFNAVRKLTQPRLVAPVKVGGEVLSDDIVVNVVSFFMLFTGLFIITGLLLTLAVSDLTTALAASIATIGNIGPGLAGVGAVENYGWFSSPAKWLLILSMLLGRLEIFTVLIVLRPSVWRR